MEYLLHILIIITLYIPFALSLNLVVGHSGLLSIMHASFYGIGAYAIAILTKAYGYHFSMAVIVGICISVSVAIIISTSLKKVRGDYYALASIGFSVIAYSVFMNLETVTGGPSGIFGISRPSFLGIDFSSNFSFFLLCLMIAGAASIALHLITKTQFCRVLHAVREDEEALIPFGYDTTKYKLIAFALGATFAAISGSLYASYMSFIDPSSFTLNESILVLTIIIFGGLASTKGVLSGVIVLMLLPEALRFIGIPNEIAAQTRMILYGLALIYFMYKRPTGLFGKYSL